MESTPRFIVGPSLPTGRFSHPLPKLHQQLHQTLDYQTPSQPRGPKLRLGNPHLHQTENGMEVRALHPPGWSTAILCHGRQFHPHTQVPYHFEGVPYW